MGKSKEKRKVLPSEELTQGKATVSQEEKSETLNVKIKVISENTDQKTAPIVGYFPSGYDPLKDSDESSSSVRIYKNAKSRNPKNPRMQLVVGVNDSNLSFAGTNYSGEATMPQLCNYALGVFDKETQTLKMVPIAGNKVFKLDPKVGGLKQPENAHVDEPREETTEAERDGNFRNLAVMYSTKKTIRRDEKRETLRQSGGPSEDKEEMDKKLKAIKINKEALEGINPAVNAQNVPPYNLDATSPEMAYPLNQIILKGEWDYLTDIYELAQAGSEMDPNAYPSFVRNRFDKVGDAKDESEKSRIAGIFSYITHLIKFRDRHSMDGVSSAKRHRFPSLLVQKFTSMFGVTSNSRIPDDKQKLLINYVLVLSLFVDDFRSDPSDMIKDLRMDAVTLRTHYEYLGCKFVRQNQAFLATLPVPLKFQTIKRKRRR